MQHKRKDGRRPDWHVPSTAAGAWAALAAAASAVADADDDDVARLLEEPLEVAGGDFGEEAPLLDTVLGGGSGGGADGGAGVGAGGGEIQYGQGDKRRRGDKGKKKKKHRAGRSMDARDIARRGDG